MSLNALQGATLILVHSLLTKSLLSFTLRTYQYLEWNGKRRERVESNFNVVQLQKADHNATEYNAIIAAPLFFLALQDIDVSMGATMSVVGQIGYVWLRTVFGYPTLPVITMAVIRYGGLALILAKVWTLAF
jgi:hypothetical protein